MSELPPDVAAPRLALLDRRRLLLGMAAGTVVPLASGCQHNPALGRSQLSLVSDSQLIAMSEEAWRDMAPKMRFSRDRARNRRVEAVGRRIVDAADPPDRDWRFHVVESKEVNAFVMPNGRVVFYSGILDLMENEDQVATVMGHEVGHVIGRHAAERASQQLGASLIAGVGAAALGAAAGGRRRTEASLLAGVLGAGLTYGFILPYSREHEYEADRLGVVSMAKASYNPRHAVRFWERMQAKGGGGAHAEFASTHPSDSNRIAAIGQLIESDPVVRQAYRA